MPINKAKPGDTIRNIRKQKAETTRETRTPKTPAVATPDKQTIGPKGNATQAPTDDVIGMISHRLIW